MALTGRFVLALALGVIPVIVVSSLFGAQIGVDTSQTDARGSASATAAITALAWILLIAVLAAVDLAIAGSPRRVDASRSAPSRLRLGERGDVELVLTNTGSRPTRALVRDAWDPSAGIEPSRHTLSIPAGERRIVRATILPTRRGERSAHHVTIRSTGPLGLAARQASIALTTTVRVLPPFTARKHLPSRLARLKELEGRTSAMIRGNGTEFDSLREYVRGDDVRSIDWRATARRSEMVVRTWRPERDRRVVIVVDCGRTSAARIGDEPRLDTAFESALLLTALASGAGDRVDVLAYDRRRRARVHGVSGPELLSKTIDALSGVEPTLVETDWSSVPAEVRRVTTQRALVVVLTSIDSVGASRALLSMLPQLTRTHTVLIGAVEDPELLDLTTRRSDRTEIYRAAAAERSRIEIAQVGAAAVRLGAEVVTAGPADLAPAIADRYIALKATGRL